MFLQFKVLFYTIFFILGLEIFAFNNEAGVYFSAIILLFSIWGSKKIGNKYSFVVIPLLFSISSLMLLYLIDSMVEKQIFILFSIFLYYLCLLGIYRLKIYSKDQTARGMIAASATATLFLFYTSFYGIYLNFPIPLWTLMAFFLVVTILTSFQYFSLIEEQKKKVLIYSIILGMVMMEITCVINFWPFGYLTTGVITLIFYYICWDLTQSYFLKILSKKRVVANVIFFSFLIILILTSSKWLPVV